MPTSEERTDIDQQAGRQEEVMSTSEATANSDQEVGGKEIPQYNIWMILFMFIWPAALFMFLIHVVVPLFWTPQPGEFLPTWIFLSVAILGNGAELVVALVLLRREGYPLTLRGLRDRARLRWPKGWKKWLLAVVVIVLAFALGMLIGPVTKTVASMPGFVPPEYWPPLTNPNVEITSVEGMFPDVTVAGNWIFFIVVFFIYGGIFNVIGEELYYRSFLLPKMRGVFGRWDWLANGLLFVLKHIYQRWVYISILPGALAMAFLGGPLGSVYLSMIFHWAGNYLMGVIMAIPVVFGGG
jgi:membrane protease YdiL (CAAX protease family)